MPDSPLVLVAGPKSAAAFLNAVAEALRSRGSSVSTLLDGSSPADWNRWPEVAVLVAFAQPCDRAMLGGASALRAIVVPSLGFEGVDVHAASRAGVVVANGRVEENVQSVAEAAIGLLLMDFYDIPAARNRMSNPSAGSSVPRTTMLRGKTLGIIGFGGIAREVALRLEAWGVQILAFSRSRITGTGRHVRQVDLDTLLSTSDIVMPLLPLTDGTRHLLDRARLLRMKEGATLINLSRGAVIDEAALSSPEVAARFRAIILDVFEIEPLPLDSALRALPNAILTPHEVARTAENMRALFDMAIANVEAVLAGRMPPTAIQRHLL
ncbi:MAG: NAD(P)-dependent oxidoreductase [Novosphingobium sp.]